VTLLADAAAHLRARDIPFALIGAGAMAVHGVARSTVDLDLLVTSAACLSATFWDTMRAAGAEPIVRAGDAADPLAGVIRLRRGSDDPVDVVVGHAAWQAAAITRARTSEVAGVRVPVVTAAELILLKLYAGGPQDLWDIAQLLGGDERRTIVRDVEARLSALPADCARLWAEVSRAR
jgi:hypothetical protein